MQTPTPNSPLFPAQQLTLSPSVLSLGGLAGTTTGVESSALVPQLPDKPLTHSSSMEIYIIPAEKNLFMQGFEPEEYEDRPPTLLRGCLYLRVLKPSRIKSITLTFKGQQRTDWPEGIPPKKTSYVELLDVLSHTWPFYQLTSPLQTTNGGADFFQELPKDQNSENDNLSLHAPDSISRSHSPLPDSSRGNFLTRNLSPATSFMKRAASPSATVNDSFTDLRSVLSAESDPSKPGFFPPGDYVYNFEHPLHPSIPETSSVTFGEVFYFLEASVARPGTFKLNLTGKMPINIIRTPSETNMEENEPIIISRDWDDQLKYDIVIGRKSIILDSYLPLAFRFIPLWGKVALHRVRVYLSENLEYYCQNKKVHRIEPPKKYLLLEHKAKKGKSLLSKSLGQDENEEDEEILPKELEFQLYVPKILNGRIKHEIHPDTSYENIQAHHWIKICLRLSRTDPEDETKRKHYEILIDSPIHILSSLAAHANTLLPAYDDHLLQAPLNNLPQYSTTTPPLSPGVIPVDTANGLGNRLLNVANENSLDGLMENSNQNFEHINNNHIVEFDADMHLEANLYQPEGDSKPEMQSPQAVPHLGTFNSPTQRPIHFIRKPSINPPPFQENSQDLLIAGNVPPPAYEEEDHSLSLSPLRIDEGLSRGRSRSSPRGPSAVLNIPLEGPVKNLLSQQLRKSDTRPSRKLTGEDISDSTSSTIKPPSGSANNVQSLNTSEPARHSTSSTNSSETGMTNSIISSAHSGETKTTNVDEESSERSELARESELPGRKMTSESKFEGDKLDGRNKSSRSSILSLNSSLDIPVELTIPLLNDSNTSLLIPNQEYKHLNSSFNSLDRRTSNVNEITKIIDLVDGDHYRVNGNLSHLRNPRIKKHYQEDSSEPISENEIKNRQKSFGIVDNYQGNRGRNSSSESTVQDDEADRTPAVDTNSNNFIKPSSGSPVPGLNYGYIIE